MKSQLMRLNSSLTRKVISLHQNGYTTDFFRINKEQLQCLQTGEMFRIGELQIYLIDCEYDLLTQSYQYIHTVETEIGYSGLLITNGIMPLNKRLAN